MQPRLCRKCFVQASFQGIAPVSIARCQDLRLHDGGSLTKIHEIDRNVDQVRQRSRHLPEVQRVDLAVDQDGNIQIAVRGGQTPRLTPIDVHRQQLGERPLQVFEHPCKVFVIHLR